MSLITNISDKERDAISSILDDFEVDCIENGEVDEKSNDKNFRNLLDIDDNIKDIWPEWHGHTYIPTAKNTSSYRSHTNQFMPMDVKKNQSIANGKNQSSSSLTTPSSQSSVNQVPLPNRSPSLVRFNLTPIIANEQNKPTFQKNEYLQPLPLHDHKAQALVETVDNIKDDIIDVMNKLTSTVYSYDKVPDLVEAESIKAASEDNESELRKPPKKKIDPLTLRSKAEVKASVIQLQKEVLTEKQLNKKLKQQYKTLREQVIKTQKRIQDLRFEHRKSNIIYNEYKRREEEYKAQHPILSASQVTSRFF